MVLEKKSFEDILGKYFNLKKIFYSWLSDKITFWKDEFYKNMAIFLDNSRYHYGYFFLIISNFLFFCQFFLLKFDKKIKNYKW